MKKDQIAKICSLWAFSTQANSGNRVAGYTPGAPSGSTADVRAKGVWANGRWTLELERRLDTDNADDTAFDLARSYKMALATFDRTGAMDKASGLIELKFASRR